MKLLLDTHAAIWFADGSSRLGAEARAAMIDPSNEVLLSAVVPWEIAIKRALGKLTVSDDYLTMLHAGGAAALPVGVEHARAVESLPPLHRDPFDRLLIAQAQIEGAVLVTNDPRIGRYSLEVLW